MTDEQINDLVLTFLDAHNGDVGSATERDLFLMVKHAVLIERDAGVLRLLRAHADADEE